MRILHVHNRYREPGGEDVVVARERQLLELAGNSVFPLDFQNADTPATSVAQFSRAVWNATSARRVVDAARKSDVDVIHIHNTWFALTPAAVIEARRASVPVVMTFHNYRLVCANANLLRDGSPCERCVGRSAVPGIRFRCYRGSLTASTVAVASIEFHRRRSTWKGLSLAIVLNEFAKQRLLAGGLPADRTVVKPNSVEDPGPRSEPPSSSNTVLFVGRLESQKGIDKLVAAWQKTETGARQLAIVGSGSLETELRASRVSSIRILGRLDSDAVTAQMLSARALVFPSQSYEAQPTVLLEALAAGLPVFHSEIGALGETCGKGGEPIDASTIETLAKGLSGVASDALVDERGSAARAEYLKRFTDRQNLVGLEQIYRKALMV